MTSHRPFRFLDLPSELRLVVYEELAITTTSHSVQVYQVPVVLRIQSLPTAVLATCRRVRDEASPVLGRKMQEISTQTSRLEVSVFAFRALAYKPEFLEAILSCIRLLRYSKTADIWASIVNNMRETMPDLRMCEDDLEALVRFIRQAAHCRTSKPILHLEPFSRVSFTPAFELRVLRLINHFKELESPLVGAIYQLDRLVQTGTNVDLILYPPDGLSRLQEMVLFSWKLKMFARVHDSGAASPSSDSTDRQQQ